MRILFLGETYRADAQTWIKGIELVSGIKVETKELTQNGNRVKRLFEAMHFLISLSFSKERYDITLAERSTSYGFFSLLVKTKVRIVAQQGISDVWPAHGFAGWYKSILQNAVYRRVDLIHGWGNVMSFAMIQAGAPPFKILIKPKGLVLSRFKFPPFEQKSHNTAIVTRSLYPIYHHADILHAVQRLKLLGINLLCSMVGDGVLNESLKALTNQLDIKESINWMGRILNEELPCYLQQAQIYISVPETEGVSSSLFEAMASGCFPIVSDLPANRAFIHSGHNGILVPAGDINALVAAIATYLKNPHMFSEGIKKNRVFIEKNCDQHKNMTYFFQRYTSLLKQKN